MKSQQFLYINKDQLSRWFNDNPVNDSEKTLIQIFFGETNLDKARNVTALLVERFSNTMIIGTSSGKEAMGTSLNKGSIVISITQFENTKIITRSFDYMDKSFSMDDSASLGELIGKFLNENNAKAAICFVSFLKGIFNGTDFLDKIYEFSPKTVLSGGICGLYQMDRLEDYFVVHNNTILEYGCVIAAMVSDVLEVDNHHALEWIPTGKAMTVTKAFKNRVYELDHRPAYEIYKTYLGEHIKQNKMYAGLIFPLFIEKGGINLLRITLKFHDDGSISYPASFMTGDKVFFGIANPSSFKKSIIKSYEYIKGRNPEAIFCYSCMARDSFLSADIINEETRCIGQIAPLSGFQTMGEFFHDENGNYVMNYTSTFLLLSEGSKRPHKYTASQSLSRTLNEDTEENFELKSLTNLLEITSSQLKESNEKFRQLAIFDSLTSIYNRGKIEQSLKKELERCKRQAGKTSFTIFLFDIDDFKMINDIYGHGTGDIVLKTLSTEIKKVLRKVDYFGRWGGEEFLIILPNTPIGQAELSVQRVMKIIRSMKFNEAFSVSVSGGLVECGKDSDFDAIITEADRKLYQAKRNGKDTYV